jgi:hypothetical protein
MVRGRLPGGAVLAAAGLLTASCAQYRYYGMASSIEPTRLEDTKLARLSSAQRARVATALSVCDGTWKQIYAIKNAEVTSKQRWTSASLLVTALGTVTIAAGFLANDREVKVDSATGQVNVEDPAAARWVTGIGLLTAGIGALGAFVLSMSTAQAELDKLQASMPQIESARDTFYATLAVDDPAVLERQLGQLEVVCQQSRERVAVYDGDQRLAALFGNEAMGALGRDLARKIEENDRQRTGAVMDVVAAGRKFDALARALGYGGARMLGQPWPVGAGGERVHAIPLRELEPELKKLAGSRASGQLSIAVYSSDERAPSAFALSASLVGADSYEGSDMLLGRPSTSVIAPAIDFEHAGGMAVVGAALALAPYTRSVSADLSGWLCQLRPPPLAAPAATPNTLSLAGCPPLVSPAQPPTVAGLRAALRLPPLPASGPAPDRLLVRAEGLGPNTPGPALGSLIWLEGRPNLDQGGGR